MNNKNVDNNQAPVDPSNTSEVGQKVEQGTIQIKEGISEQSNEWEDKQERNNNNSAKIKDYLEKPFPKDQ